MSKVPVPDDIVGNSKVESYVTDDPRIRVVVQFGTDSADQITCDNWQAGNPGV